MLGGIWIHQPSEGFRFWLNGRHGLAFKPSRLRVFAVQLRHPGRPAPGLPESPVSFLSAISKLSHRRKARAWNWRLSPPPSSAVPPCAEVLGAYSGPSWGPSSIRLRGDARFLIHAFAFAPFRFATVLPVRASANAWEGRRTLIPVRRPPYRVAVASLTGSMTSQ